MDARFPPLLDQTPPPDAALGFAQVAAAPTRWRSLLDAPAAGREWALVRVSDPGTALDGRIAWADLPAGVPVEARVFARFDGAQAIGARDGRLADPLRASDAANAWLLDAHQADAAERAFAWSVLLASDAPWGLAAAAVVGAIGLIADALRDTTAEARKLEEQTLRLASAGGTAIHRSKQVSAASLTGPASTAP